MTGGVWGAAVRAEVGERLAALDAHHGACRVEADGTRAVSWWFPTRSRRERCLVFRALGGRLDDWEVTYREQSASEYGRATTVHASRSVRTDRAGLAATATSLVERGLPRGGGRVLVEETPRRVTAPVADGPAPGPRAAQAAAAGRRPPPPPGAVRAADGLLGVVVAVALFAACRIDIDLAPSIAAFAAPLLVVSLAWTLIGMTGAERRRSSRR